MSRPNYYEIVPCSHCGLRSLWVPLLRRTVHLNGGANYECWHADHYPAPALTELPIGAEIRLPGNVDYRLNPWENILAQLEAETGGQ